MTWQQLKKILAFYGRFTLSFTQVGYLARRLFWPKFVGYFFRGQYWLVTGGSGGLGRQMVLEALRGGATVVAAARSESKLAQLRAEVTAAGFGSLETECCDFTSTADTERLIERLVARGRRFDALMNNVGVLNDDLIVTSEGREASFVSNLLSHYQLTEALIAKQLLGKGSVVVNVTSGGGYNVPLMTGTMNLTDPKRYNGTVAYSFHKRAQMVLNQYWRDNYRARGIDFFVMHPGWADTAGVQRSLPRFRKILKSILRDAKSGADTAIWLAAQRPPQPEEELVWFDRKVRPAHVYLHTRSTRETPQSLVAWLQAELARGPC
jgi:dehydrogenase/reductase SDR family protein 12